MRPLNRPMFKTGGPIKEGIMSGMKDKPQQLVQPAADGSRPGYAGPLAFLAPLFGIGGTAARVGATRAAPSLIPRITQGFRNIFQTQKPAPYTPIRIAQSEGGKKLGLKPKVIKTAKDTVNKEQVGSIYETRPFFRNDPTFMLASGIYRGITNPKAKGLLASGARLVYNPTGAVTGLYLAGQYFNKDGEETPPPPDSTVGGTSGAPGGGDPDMFYNDPNKKQEGEGTPTLTENEQREALKKKYYDIMEIDKLTKRATGDALIAASQDLANLNREGITLKEGLRSGDLQSRLISSVSKAFDKPDKTKDAIDAAILKAEITKDINREKDDLDRRVKESTLAVRKKQLEGDTFEEAVAEATIKENAPKGRDLAVLFKVKTGNDATVIDSTKVPQGVDEEVFLKEQIEVARKEGTPTPPGYYVISDSIFIIDAQGNISRRL
tara:strand:- start:702 stop:2012 length:1311 start_codon:yes stop_codon:yes gene_type:complete